MIKLSKSYIQSIKVNFRMRFYHWIACCRYQWNKKYVTSLCSMKKNAHILPWIGHSTRQNIKVRQLGLPELLNWIQYQALAHSWWIYPSCSPFLTHPLQDVTTSVARLLKEFDVSASAAKFVVWHLSTNVIHSHLCVLYSASMDIFPWFLPYLYRLNVVQVPG